MAGRKIKIEFLGDSKDLQRAMGDADSKSGRLAGSLKKVGKMAAVGLGAGLAVGAVALVKMTQGAIEDEAAQARLEKQLQNSAGATDKQVESVERWITAQGKALGVTDDELRPALEKLVTATGDVKEAQELAALAMDVSAGSGKSLDAVSMALMKAQNGQISGLSRLGIETKNAAGETLTFEQATKNMAETFGGQAATKAETLQGKMDRLKLILSEAGETIGSKLIPVVTQMADWFLNKGLPAVMAFGGWLGDHLPPIFDRIKTVVSTVMGAMQGDVGGGLGKIRQIFTDVTSIITSLWDRFGGTLTDYAVKTFANMKQIIGGALTVVQGIFQTFSALLKGDWSGAWDGIKKILSGAFELIKGMVKQSLNVMGTLFEIGWSAIKGIVGAVWDGIKTVVANGARDVVGWIADIPGKLRDKIGNFRDAGGALIGAFVDGMRNAGGVIEGIAGNVWSAVRSLLNGAIDKINAALEFTISLPGPDLTVNPANIPHMAKGGIVNRPTLALIGEDGPEAVVPLGAKNRPRGGIPGMSGGGGLTVNIYGALDPMAVARQVEQILSQYQRSTGEPLNFTTVG